MDASTATKTFTDLFVNAPEDVVAKENFRRLVREASNELKRLQRFEHYLRLRKGAFSSRRPNGGGPRGEVLPTQVSPAVPVPVIPGSYNSGLEGVEAFANCFADARWSMAWYGPVVCLDRTCADLVQDKLVGSDWESFVLAVFNVSNSVFALWALRDRESRDRVRRWGRPSRRRPFQRHPMPVTGGLGQSRETSDLLFSQVSASGGEQGAHGCLAIPAPPQNLGCPSGTRIGVEIASQHDHQINVFAHLAPDPEPVLRGALSSVSYDLADIRLTNRIKLSRKKLLHMAQ